MINKLREAESILPDLLRNSDNWNSLDVDYYPPRVERLWMQYDEDHRLYIHIIHPTNEDCLFHKHRWPAAFKILKGSYEMGVAYYEMTNTHTLHYVRPLDKESLSLMITGPLYPEAEFRKEILNKDLKPLSKQRKEEILAYVSYIYK